MNDFPATQDPTTDPTFVHTFMPLAPGLARGASVGGVVASPGNITWVANLAVFMPVILPWPYPVRRVFWVNGTPITTTNADFGIYTRDGTRLYSTGSTALAGVSGPQYVDPADFLLPPGIYYFAYVCDNTTTRAHGTTLLTATVLRQSGVFQQASALPLPASMASAVAATQALYALCGITRTASGF